MKWINKFLKFKKYIIILIIILIVLVALFSIFSLRVDFNIAYTVGALGILGLVYILYLLMKHKMKPKNVVNVINKIEFKAPSLMMKPFKTYKLNIQVIHQTEAEGEITRMTMDEIKFSFNKKDHPNVYDYCLNLIHQETTKSLNSAKMMYPDSEVIAGEVSLPKPLIQIQEKTDA